jgi:hypothetical protein
MKVNFGETITAGAIVGFGVLALVLGSSYPLGSLSQMGPGYFPVMLGAFTVLIGLATMLQVRGSSTPSPVVYWLPAFLVLASIVAWALTAERFGLVPATFASVVLSRCAKPPVRIVPTLGLAALASAACVLVFVNGFSLPLQPFKW